jgi:hypothetical protein
MLYDLGARNEGEGAEPLEQTERIPVLVNWPLRARYGADWLLFFWSTNLALTWAVFLSERLLDG